MGWTGPLAYQSPFPVWYWIRSDLCVPIWDTQLQFCVQNYSYVTTFNVLWLVFNRTLSILKSITKKQKKKKSSVHLCSAPTLYCYACKNFSKVGRYACTQLYEIDPWGQFLDRKVEWLRPSPNNCATNSCEIVGRWRTATFDRANSMNVAEQKSYKKSTPGYSKLSHNFFARPINIEIRAEQMSN